MKEDRNLNRGKLIPINADQIRRDIDNANAIQDDLSLRIGMSRSYISYCLCTGTMSRRCYADLYKLLGSGKFKKRYQDYTHKPRARRKNHSRKRVHINSELYREGLYEKGLNYKDVADKVGVDPSTVSKWFRADEIPADIVDELAELAGVKAGTVKECAEIKQQEVIVTEKVYTEAAVKEIIRQEINTFADHIIDYLGEALDILEKEGSDGSI